MGFALRRNDGTYWFPAEDPTTPDFFIYLGIDRSASDATITRALRNARRRLSLGGADDQGRSIELLDAIERVLLDPLFRGRYVAERAKASLRNPESVEVARVAETLTAIGSSVPELFARSASALLEATGAVAPRLATSYFHQVQYRGFEHPSTVHRLEAISALAPVSDIMVRCFGPADVTSPLRMKLGLSASVLHFGQRLVARELIAPVDNRLEGTSRQSAADASEIAYEAVTTLEREMIGTDNTTYRLVVEAEQQVRRMQDWPTLVTAWRESCLRDGYAAPAPMTLVSQDQLPASRSKVRTKQASAAVSRAAMALSDYRSGVLRLDSDAAFSDGSVAARLVETTAEAQQSVDALSGERLRSVRSVSDHDL